MEGVGPRTLDKLLDAFGSEEQLERAALDLELDRFVAIRGISTQRALDIISSIRGVQDFPFLKTDAAAVIYQDIVRRIQEFASTSYAKNKVLLLRPLRDIEARQAVLKRVMDAKERVRQLPRERLASILSGLPALKEPRPVFDSTKVVVVEDDATLKALEPLSGYCEVLLPDDLGRPEEYDLIVYVCTSGSLEFEGMDQVHVVLGRPEAWQIFPESVVDFFRANASVLESLLELGDFVEGMEVAVEVLDLLSGLRASPPVHKEDVLDDLIRDLNEGLRERLSKLSLEGPEVLELLQRGLPRRVKEVFTEVLEEGEQQILAKSGLRIRLEPSYPLSLPEEEVERALRELRRVAKMSAFESLQRTARLLTEKADVVKQAYRRALEFDFEQALGNFALEYALQPPRWGEELRLRGALHLALNNNRDAQRVDYLLSQPHRVALLTGANSGGKTTLLETVAQAYILATMGLPVNAREAVLEPVEACYFFSRQGSMTAGALEGFLTTFMPLALDDRRKVVLADELESMTEPEAAAAVLATFLERLRGSGSYATVVTHAARSILRSTDIRVDGIEAQGLDDRYNLIVDRSPKPDLIARSTPELILQRLMALNHGEEGTMYELVLDKLQLRLSH